MFNDLEVRNILLTLACLSSLVSVLCIGVIQSIANRQLEIVDPAELGLYRTSTGEIVIYAFLFGTISFVALLVSAHLLKNQG